jgi:hypothetical protein
VKRKNGDYEVPLYSGDGRRIIETVLIPGDVVIGPVEAIVYDGHVWIYDKDLKGFRSCQAWIDYASPIAKITPLPEPRAKREKQTKVRITK